MQPIQFTENVKEFLASITQDQRNQLEKNLAMSVQQYCNQKLNRHFGDELRKIIVEIDSIFLNIQEVERPDRFVRLTASSD